MNDDDQEGTKWEQIAELPSADRDLHNRLADLLQREGIKYRIHGSIVFALDVAVESVDRAKKIIYYDMDSQGYFVKFL